MDFLHLSFVILISAFLIGAEIVSGEDASLYQRIFGKDSPVLSNEEVSKLLREIQPMLPETSWGVTRKDAATLIEAANLDQRRCYQPELFFKTFRILKRQERVQHLVQRKTEGPNQDDGWNESIISYLEKSHANQVKQCIDLFMAGTKQVAASDLKLLEEIVSALIDTEMPATYLTTAIVSIIKKHLDANLLNKMGFNKAEKVRGELQKITDTCERVEEALKYNDLTLRWLAARGREPQRPNEYLLYRPMMFDNAELMLWLKYNKICQGYNNGFLKMEMSQPIRESLPKRLASEFSIQF